VEGGGADGYGAIVQFSGAIATAGTNPVAFTLPPDFRPSWDVFVPVDMCNGTHGQLHISPSGDVTVQPQAWADAQCFTSLDGVSFVQEPDEGAQFPHYTTGAPLDLQNGWSGGHSDNYLNETAGPFGTSYAGFEDIGDGVVRLWGAIATSGTNPIAFTLPPGLRPAHNVFVPVDMYNGNIGRLDIYPNGDVQVEAEAGSWPDAQLLTSLDGVTFVADTSATPPPTTPLSPQNGWTGGPYGTASPQAAALGDTVYLQGAMTTSGTNPVAFTLPPGLRPQYNRFVLVDMCNGTSGRLDIYPNGDVQVETEKGAWNNAQCFTSLDGVSFIL
jgi:hypothetical protein